MSAGLLLNAHKTLVYSIHVSQGSVATRLRCGGIFSDSFIADFPHRVCQWINYANPLKIVKVVELVSLVHHFLEYGVHVLSNGGY